MSIRILKRLFTINRIILEIVVIVSLVSGSIYLITAIKAGSALWFLSSDEKDVAADYQKGFLQYSSDDVSTRTFSLIYGKNNPGEVEFLTALSYDLMSLSNELPLEEMYLDAARLGFDEAQYTLGELYDYGRHVQQDDALAVKWYRKAAEQGFAQAQLNLGVNYVKGEGVRQDYPEAVKWWRKSAKQGLAEAQYNLGITYNNGAGVRRDYVLAYMWYYLAASQGNTLAQENLDNLAKQMSSSKLADAQKLARNCLAANYIIC